MDIEKLVTLAASLVGAFWIILQIVTHIHEKGHRNVVLAALLLALGCVPAVAFLYYFHHPTPRPPGAPPSGPPVAAVILPPASTSPRPSRVTSAVATPSPAPSPTASVLAPGSPFVPPPDLSPEPSSSAPPAASTPAPTPSPPVLSSAFQVDFSHNLVGGLSQILLQCSFTQTGTDMVRLLGYTITVHVRTHGDPAPRDHVFERILATPVEVSPGTPSHHTVAVDPEIGDLLLAYRKDPSGAWVRLTWRGVTADNRPVQVSSSNNE